MSDRTYDSIEAALKDLVDGPTDLERFMVDVGLGVVEVLRLLEFRRMSPSMGLNGQVDDVMSRLRAQVEAAVLEWKHEVEEGEVSVAVESLTKTSELPLWSAEVAVVGEMIDAEVGFDLWKTAIDTMVACEKVKVSEEPSAADTEAA